MKRLKIVVGALLVLAVLFTLFVALANRALRRSTYGHCNITRDVVVTIADTHSNPVADATVSLRTPRDFRDSPQPDDPFLGWRPSHTYSPHTSDSEGRCVIRTVFLTDGTTDSIFREPGGQALFDGILVEGELNGKMLFSRPLTDFTPARRPSSDKAPISVDVTIKNANKVLDATSL